MAGDLLSYVDVAEVLLAVNVIDVFFFIYLCYNSSITELHLMLLLNLLGQC